MTADSINPTGPFLDLPPPYCDFDGAAVCILPVPYDATSSYRPGSRFGPAALIAASHQVEVFDEQLKQETYRVGIHTCAALAPNASGPEAMVADVRGRCEKLLEQGKFVVVVGGEHTVTLGAVDAMRRMRKDRPFGVVQFDAHRDLRSEYESSEWSHACVAAHIVGWGLPLLQVGVRAWSRDEQEAAGPAPILTLTARELHRGDPAALLERALAQMPEEIYLTFDLDALDPSILPATGTPEPGGLGWYPAVEMLDVLTRRKRIIGMDFVELAPIPGLVAPNVLAARLLYRTLGMITRRWPPGRLDRAGNPPAPGNQYSD